MKTKQYTTYQFDELPEESKQKALDHYRDINVDYDDWHEFILDDWKTKLEALGYDGIQISYSGFWSQGDGASFTAQVDLAKWLKAHKLANQYRKLYNANEEIDACIERVDNHYSHSNTVRAAISPNYYRDDLDEQITAVETMLEDEKDTLSAAIYKELESEYEYQTTDEAVIAALEANEYEFTLNGRID